MNNTQTISFDNLYTNKYFYSQLEKFNNRNANHWAPRIRKVFDDISSLNVSKGQVLDLGCSIGTYAYEFASRGHTTSGIDLSSEAIAIAQQLAKDKGLNIDYKIGDISIKDQFAENSFNLIYAGDIIEHLEDDILKKTIDNCFYWLKPGGYFIFHTVPLKYDYIFHKSILWILLIPFCILSDSWFKKIVKLLYYCFNFSLQVLTGRSWRDREKETVHCNLQTKNGFESILTFNNFIIKESQLQITEDRFKKPLKLFLFKNKEYFQKDLFGIAQKEVSEI